MICYHDFLGTNVGLLVPKVTRIHYITCILTRIIEHYVRMPREKAKS